MNRNKPNVIPTVRTLTALGLAALLLPAPARSAPEQARRADDFIDTIGVNAHWSYTDTVYSNYAALKKALTDAGIRHVRSDTSKAQDLAGAGVHTMTVADVPVQYYGPNGSGPTDPSVINNADSSAITAIVADIKAKLAAAPGSIDAIEGPNEPDLFWVSYHKQYRGHGYQPIQSGETNDAYLARILPDIMQGVIAFQSDLYQALKADPATKNIPVLGPPFSINYAYRVNHSAYAGAFYGSVDWGNFHPYPDGGNPFSNDPFYDTISNYYQNGNFPTDNIDVWPRALTDVQLLFTKYDSSGNVVDQRPMASSETGYATNQPGGTSLTAQGKYLPRLFAEYARLGIRRTYDYELADLWNDPNGARDNNFGLLKNDLTPKPSYTALKNVIGVLAEPSQPAGFSPGSLDYTMTVSPVLGYTDPSYGKAADYDRTQNVHHLLLEKSDGTFYLVLWHEISDEDISVTPHRQLQPPALPATLTFTSPVQKADLYTLDATGAMTQSAAALTGGNTISLSVPDRVTILRLTPGAAAPHGPFHGPHPLPGTVQAEDYDLGGEGSGFHQVTQGAGNDPYRTDNALNSLYADSAASGGHALGWTAAGQWTQYSVSVAASGAYTLTIREAGYGGTAHLEDETGRKLTGTVTLPSTNNWNAYTNVSVPVTLTGGAHVYRLVQETGGYNLDALSFTPVYSVNAGGGAAGSFTPDAGASGGATYSATSAIDTTAAGAAPAAVYQSERYGGTFSYAFSVSPAAPGASYTVKLHFAEIYWTAAGQRVFNVAINGASVLSNFDIFKDAGAKNKAVVKTFTGVQPDANGKITVTFTAVKDNAKVSGIEVSDPSDGRKK